MAWHDYNRNNGPDTGILSRRALLGGAAALATPLSVATAKADVGGSELPTTILNEREALHQYRTWLLREAAAVTEELERGGELRVSARGMTTSCPAFWFHIDAKTVPLDRAKTVMAAVGCKFSRSVTG